MDNENKPIVLLGQLVDTTEVMIDFLEKGDFRAVDEIITFKKLETIQSVCANLGHVVEIARAANSIVTLVRDIQRIRAESTIILTELQGRIQVLPKVIDSLSATLESLRNEIRLIPNDFSDPELMNLKAGLIDRLTMLSMRLADLV